MGKDSVETATTSDLTRPNGEGRGVVLLERLLAAMLLALAVTVIWLVYRPIGDLYVALAAGRDIMAGKLGQPDEWSFTADNLVWINQNWGTHLVYYLSYLHLGEWGLIGVKGLLIAILGIGVMLACRERKVSWSASMIMAAGVVLAGKAFIDQRPNLTSLALDPVMLWLLYRTQKHPHRIWWAMALVGLWANLHGGFFFGIGMIGLWTLCQSIPAFVANIRSGGGFGEALGRTAKKYWPMYAASVGAILLAAFVSPFGYFQAAGSDTFWRDWNLTHPFIMARSEVWNQVREWRPILDLSEVRYGSAWEFVVILGIFGVLGSMRVARAVFSPDKRVGIRHLFTAVLVASVGSLVCLLSLAALFSPQFDPNTIRRNLQSLTVPQYARNIIMLGRLMAAMAGCLAVFGFIGIARCASALRKEKDRPDTRQIGNFAFDLLLSMLVILMAFRSRRFIPLATIMVAPLVARQLDWLLRTRLIPDTTAAITGAVIGFVSVPAFLFWGESALFMAAGVVAAVHIVSSAFRSEHPFRIFPPGVVVVALAIPAIQFGMTLSKRYVPNNPLYGDETFYERMVGQMKQPTQLTEFINANNIEGRVLHEWRWEGYLHWRCPQLKLLLGGRAQQIYTEDDWYLGMSLRSNMDLRIRVKDPGYTERTMRRQHIPLIACPVDSYYIELLQQLVHNAKSPDWTYVYRDDRDTLLADTATEYGRELVEKAIRGDLTYPSEAIGYYSRALIIQTRAGRKVATAIARKQGMPAPTMHDAYELLVQAVRQEQILNAYMDLARVAPIIGDAAKQLNQGSEKAVGQRPGDKLLSSYIRFFQEEDERLGKMPKDVADGLDLVASRIYVRQGLAMLYETVGMKNEAYQTAKSIQELKAEAVRMKDRWR